MNESTLEGLITRSQLAEKLGKSPDTLFLWARDGYGPKPVRLGGRVHYRTAEVSEFVATLTGEPVA